LTDESRHEGQDWLPHCHTFRATGITAYLGAGGTLENAQAMAAHESPRTTTLYDRTGDEITLDEVEKTRRSRFSAAAMAALLTAEDSSGASRRSAPMSTSVAASAFGSNRRRRSCGGTESNSGRVGESVALDR
jgi:hypothetical protein